MVCLLPAWVWSMVGALDLEVLKLEKIFNKILTIIGSSLLDKFSDESISIPRMGILGAAISSMIGFVSLFQSHTGRDHWSDKIPSYS